MNTDTALTIAALLFGAFCYFTSGVLKDKGKIITLEIKVEDIENDIKELKEEKKLLEKQLNDFINKNKQP